MISNSDFSISFPFASSGADLTTLIFDPLLPALWLLITFILFLIVFILSASRTLKTFWTRLPAFIVFVVILLNPVAITETRQSSSNIVLVVLDQTESQTLGDRQLQTSNAQQRIEDLISQNEALRLQLVTVKHTQRIDSADHVQETTLYSTLQNALMNVDRSRLGAVILISDGQIHDLPLPQNTPLSGFDFKADLDLPEHVPLHSLITGSKHEKDRQVVIDSAPYYGITGQDATITIKVISNTGSVSQNQHSNGSNSTRAEFIPVTLHVNGEISETRSVRAGESTPFTVNIAQAGSNIYRFSIPDIDGELSIKNNQKITTINGVRDRLQVLLISGKPNHGGRMWRDILRSDASVDLVHFTILREPGKIDTTPKEEMSLIEFPVRELFETKINNFDLIILDRYGLTYLLPNRYFENMHNFVEQGGGLLVTIGPEALNDYSIFDTILGDALPAELLGGIQETEFQPALTSLGRRHPVTSSLNDYIADSQTDNLKPNDGSQSNNTLNFPLATAPWLRQIDVQPKPNTQTVLSGANKDPLLILDRYNDGRVALLNSDQLWLWARGYDQGGPNRLLLKRMIHWLMKEPELDEEGLSVSIRDRDITVTKRALTDAPQTIRMVTPSGNVQNLTLTSEAGQAARAMINANESGIYQFSSEDGKMRFIMVGNLEDPEQIDLLSTVEKLKPLSKATGGLIDRLEDLSSFDLHLQKSGKPMTNAEEGSLFSSSSDDWLGVLDREAFVVSGIKKTPLIPLFYAFLAVFIAVIISWLWESRLFKRK